MKTAIAYYTGTGNSLWAARYLSQHLEKCELISMAKLQGPEIVLEADTVGFVFPVHMWGIPHAALRFIEHLRKEKGKYYFAVAVNAGQVSRTCIQLRECLGKSGHVLAAGYDIRMPSNYIPWGGPGPVEEQQRRFDAAEAKLKRIAEQVSQHRTGPVEKGPLWQRIVFTWLYKLSFNQIPTMDKGFWVDEQCNGCTICQKVCPAHNITMEGKKPKWHGKCEHCLACIQWCPQKSIQYGKKTPAFERYHHPEVKIADIMAGVGK